MHKNKSAIIYNYCFGFYLPCTVSSALQLIWPLDVCATQVYKPASSGRTCWNMRASESSSSPRRTLSLSCSGSNGAPSFFQVKVGFSPGASSPSDGRSLNTSLESRSNSELQMIQNRLTYILIKIKVFLYFERCIVSPRRFVSKS